MLEVYKPQTNREAVGLWLCSAAKRPSKRSALVSNKSTLKFYWINIVDGCTLMFMEEIIDGRSAFN